MAEIGGALTIANHKHELFQFSDDKWVKSHVDVNICRLMKCLDKGYILVRDKSAVCRHISEIERSAEKIAVLPPNHQLKSVSAIGYREKIYTAGGMSHFNHSSVTVNVFDVPTKKWTAIKNMNCARFGCSLVAMDDKLFVGGGWNRRFCGSNVVECLDLNSEKWTSLHSTSDTECVVTSLNGKLVATGGLHDRRTVEVYDNSTNTWLPLPSMNERRLWHGACSTAENRLYVAGGCGTSLVEYFEM